ncbi:MAG: response regulator [Gammaproteobacteria bacterium]|nr:response regulator [Gammaproteobacteria bacterium]
MTKKQVFILDDSDDFRQSTQWMLEGMGYQVHEFDNPEHAMTNMAASDPAAASALLLDIRMPIMSGLEVHDLMIERGIGVPVIYMTAHGDVPLAVTAMSKGALTFLEKPLDEHALTAALELAHSSSVQRRRNLTSSRSEYLKIKERLALLTAREEQVVEGMLRDETNKEIAESLNISVKTVELYRSRVMTKLEAKNAAHLVRMVVVCETA